MMQSGVNWAWVGSSARCSMACLWFKIIWVSSVPLPSTAWPNLEVARYGGVAPIDTVFVLAVWAQREDGFKSQIELKRL